MHKRYFYSFSLLLGASLLLLSSCLKDDYTKQANAEIDQIKAYVNAHYPGAKVESNGFCIVDSTIGNHDYPKNTSDYVVIRYICKLLDGTIFDSNDTTVQLSNGYIPSFKVGGPITYNMGAILLALGSGISQISEGGKATIIIPSTLTQTVNFQPRLYEVRLLKVYHDIITARKQEFAKMIDSLGFQLKDSTKHGSFATYFGDTSKKYIARPGDTVRIKYYGYLLDSVSNSIIKRRLYFTQDTILPLPSDTSLIFQDALMNMKRGWNANVYVPYYRAYGPNILPYYLYDGTKQILVPPFSNLMFHVELIGFLTKKNGNGVLVDDTSKN
jgi:FKBP-type peptidyl-prolyl cis-trans isomerases 1